MAAVRQPGFSVGELAPSLWGRTDLPRYGAGAQRLFNFLVSKQGAAVSRPGAQYLGTASGATEVVQIAYPIKLTPAVYRTAGAGVKLVGFQYSDTDTLQNAVLEFGEKSIRVWQGGAVVATVSGSVPYHRADLKKLRWAQSGDVLYLACAGYSPATITRTDATTWAYAAIAFTRAGPADINTSTPTGARVDEATWGTVDANHPAKTWVWQVTEIRKDSRGVIYESAPVRCNGLFWYGQPWNPLVTFKLGTVVYSNGSGFTPYWQSLQNGNLNHSVNDAAWYRNVQNWDHTITYGMGDWVSTGSGYKQSLQAGNLNHATTDAAWWGDTGTQWQSDDFSATEVSVSLYPNRPITIQLPTVPSDANFITFRIYRGRGGVFGWVGDANGAFVDGGADPDFTIQPPQGTNPFLVLDGVTLRTESPLAVCFFQDRLVYLGTIQRPNFILASATGDYTNFDSRLVPEDSDALLFALASRKREFGRSIIGGERLFVLTDSSIWTVDGGQGAPLAPASVDARVQVDIGADWPVPLQVAGALLWVRNKGTGVRRIGFDFESGKFQSQDLSITSEHLVLGHTVADWCYAEDPWSVIWVVRDDGVLLSLTYAPEDQLWAWGQHALQGPNVATSAVVESVCSIVEGDEDVVYLAIQGPAPAAWAVGTTYAANDLVSYSGFTYASIAGGNLGHAPPVDGTTDANWYAVQNAVGPSWICRLSTRQEVNGRAPACLDCYHEFDGVTVGPGGGAVIFTGLTWLATRAVYAVAVDASGAETNLGTATVGSNGAVSFNLATSAAKVFIGLQYDCEFQSLPLAAAREKQKTVAQVALELRASGGTIEAGPDFTNLESFASDLRGDLTQDVVKFRVTGDWKTTGTIAVRRSDPLPITILAVTREVEAGAK